MKITGATPSGFRLWPHTPQLECTGLEFREKDFTQNLSQGTLTDKFVVLSFL